MIITTARLYLREFIQEDAPSLYALNADPEVLRYTGDEAFLDEAAAAAFIQNYAAYKTTGMGRWAVIQQTDQRFLGWAGFKLHPDGMVDLGFRFFQKEWGKGFATEVAQACVNYGFQELQLPEIAGRVLAKNIASIKVLEKVGMQYWKKGPCDGWQGAEYYRILNPLV